MKKTEKKFPKTITMNKLELNTAIDAVRGRIADLEVTLTKCTSDGQRAYIKERMQPFKDLLKILEKA